MAFEPSSKLLVSIGQATSPRYDDERNLIPDEDRTGVVTMQVSDDSGNVVSAYTWKGVYGENQYPCGMPGCAKSVTIDGVLYIFYLNNVVDSRENNDASYLYTLTSEGEHHRICAAEGYYTDYYDNQEVGYRWNIQSMVLTSENILVVAVTTSGREDGVDFTRVVIRRSLDLGATFEEAINVDDCGTYLPKLVIDDNDVIYIVMGSIATNGNDGPPFSLAKSTDLGETWETVETVPETPIENNGYTDLNAATAGNKLYIFYTNWDTLDESYIFLTEDQGDTWTSKYVDIPSYSPYGFKPAYFRNTGFFAYEDIVCFVGRDESGNIYVCRSIDNADTWTTIGWFLNYPSTYYPDLCPDYVPHFETYENFYQNGPCFTYTSCGSYHADTGNLAFLTTVDAGLTWEVKQSGLSNTAGVSTILEK